jgi:hypothetical protein
MLRVLFASVIFIASFLPCLVCPCLLLYVPPLTLPVPQEQRQAYKLELAVVTLRAVHERAAVLVTFLSAELQESLKISRLTGTML